jgi:hypothetical protein
VTAGLVAAGALLVLHGGVPAGVLVGSALHGAATQLPNAFDD